MGRITAITTKTSVNQETGEMTTTEKEEIIRYGKTADFVMTFTQDLGYLKHLSKGEILLMFGLLQKVNQDNELILNSSLKAKIAKNFDLKVNSINPLLSNLVKKQMIMKTEDRGIYRLNTFIFGKGGWSNIKKQRMYTEWDFKNLTKKVIVEQDYLDEDEILEKQMLQIQKQRDELKRRQQAEKSPNLFGDTEEQEKQSDFI